MYVSLNSIFHSPSLSSMYIVAGEKGLSNGVKRVSVADWKFNIEKLISGTMHEGDLFISGLAQFENRCGQDVIDYFDALIYYKCCGLIIVTEDNISCIDETIIQKCNDAQFPVLCLKDEISYADLIGIINQYILIETTNTLREYYLQRLVNDDLPDSERNELTNRLNSEMSSLIVVICWIGDIFSDLNFAQFYVDVQNKATDVYIYTASRKYLLLTNNDKKAIETHAKVQINRIKEVFSVKNMGVSQIYPVSQLQDAVKSAEYAVTIANTMCQEIYFATRLSTYPLLISIKNRKEVRDFYTEFINIIEENSSAKRTQEILDTIEIFAQCGGNYKLTSEKMHQHVNTIWYRIKQLKLWLGLDENSVEFYEMISLIAKLRLVYEME